MNKPIQLFAWLCLILVFPAQALNLNPTMTITAFDRNDTAYLIGTLKTTPVDNGYAIKLELAEEQFEDAFLSMRDFKCLDLGKEKYCHLRYFYDINNVIRDNDLVDLEYNLLFIRKLPSDYNSVDAWNGLYYQIKYEDGKLLGTLKETDLNVLQSPPEGGDMRPIKPEFLHEASDTQTLPRLVIE